MKDSFQDTHRRYQVFYLFKFIQFSICRARGLPGHFIQTSSENEDYDVFLSLLKAADFVTSYVSSIALMMTKERDNPAAIEGK